MHHQNDSGGNLQKNEAVKRELVLFDFDGTITNRDSFIDFIRYYHGNTSFITGFVRLLPILLLYKAKVIPNWKAKEKVITYFFGQESFAKFQAVCDDYSANRIPKIVRPKALERLKEHIKKGDKVYLVSASAENWLSSWCCSLGIDLIATKLEVKNGKVTGKINGLNCYGKEKVNRIKAMLSLDDFQQIHCYGDSSGDHDMLAIAHHKNYRLF